MLNTAIAYARRGWPVFPLVERGKTPRFSTAHPVGDPLRATCQGECGRDGHGFYDATTNLQKIQRWWTPRPAANIGLRTGVAFYVLDIDGPTGLASLKDTSPDIGDDVLASIVGPTVLTGGGGHHLLVAVTGLGNKTGFIPSCDFRGEGGYVVAVGSVHPSGERYEWLDGYGPDKQSIRPAPKWLIESLTTPAHGATPITRSNIASSPYARVALRGELGRLVLAPEGQRNDVLNRAAFSLGQLIQSGELDAREALPPLVEVARWKGLTENEIEGTIESGINAGFRTPR
jgi:hypothetical protein